MANLLVVEDDKQIRSTLSNLLAGEHFCRLAATAEEGLAWLNKEEYDVVLTDISLPEMNGMEFFGVVRQLQPDTPVIFISAIEDSDHIHGLIKMGAFDYLVKPFDVEDLRISLSQALEERQRAKDSRQRGDSGTDDRQESDR